MATAGPERWQDTTSLPGASRNGRPKGRGARRDTRILLPLDRSRSSWRNPGRRALVWSLRIGASLAGLTGVAGAEAAPGIVVDSVAAGYAASMGGVREGDILLSRQEQGGQRTRSGCTNRDGGWSIAGARWGWCGPSSTLGPAAC